MFAGAPAYLRGRGRCYRGKMFKKLYDWTMSLAASRHAPLALGAIAFAESSFFPVPPDVILVPMSLAEPKKAWYYAAHLHGRLGRGRRARLCLRLAVLRHDRANG